MIIGYFQADLKTSFSVSVHPFDRYQIPINLKHSLVANSNYPVQVNFEGFISWPETVFLSNNTINVLANLNMTLEKTLKKILIFSIFNRGFTLFYCFVNCQRFRIIFVKAIFLDPRLSSNITFYSPSPGIFNTIPEIVIVNKHKKSILEEGNNIVYHFIWIFQRPPLYFLKLLINLIDIPSPRRPLLVWESLYSFQYLRKLLGVLFYFW